VELCRPEPRQPRHRPAAVQGMQAQRTGHLHELGHHNRQSEAVASPRNGQRFICLGWRGAGRSVMHHFLVCTALAASLLSLPVAALAQSVEQYRDDALSIDRLIDENYAYLDRFTDGKASAGAKMQA